MTQALLPVLPIAAGFYNSNLKKSDGKSEAVLFGKILTDEQRQCLVWDIERGVPATSLPYAWQTDTCIGGWHYERSIYDRSRCKSARTVIHMLADIVSNDGRTLYVIVMGWPEKTRSIRSLGKKAGLLDKSVSEVALPGSRENVRWEQDDDALTLTSNSPKPGSEAASAAVFKLTLR